MKSVNSDYLRFIEENNFLDYAYRIELQRPDGKAYTYEGDVIQSFEINGTESSSGFSIGETLSLQLKLTLLLEERQGEKDIPTNSKLIPYITYKWDDKSEETCMGIFYVNDVKADHRHKVSISAVDAMSATDIFGGTFTETQLTPPVDNRFIAQEIAGLFPDDIVFDVSEEPGLVVNTLVFNEYIYGKSFREILGYIAAANSGFARVVPELVVINEETGETALKSRLQFATYKDTGIVLRMNNDDDTPNLYSKIKSVKSGTNKFSLKKIATTAYVKNKDTESEDNPNDENKSAYATATITYPTNSNAKPYETLEFDCPFIASSGCYIRDGVVRIDYATEQNLKAIYDEISQISYYPIDATLFGYHFLECGDIVKIENTYGEILDLYIQDVKMTVGGGVTVTVSSKYDYTKSNTLKNSVTARVDSLAKELHSFANNFEISKNKIEMSVSKAEAETIIQENLADLNMGVNQWIREVYNLDGVEGIEKPRSIQLQGKSPIITDIIKDPEDAKFPTLEEFTGTEDENNTGAIFGTRTVRYATCVKVNERTTIGIMVRQGYENTSFIPEFDNVAVYVNTDLKLPPDINTQDGVREYLKLSKLDKVVHGVDENGEPTTELVPEEITEGTEHYGYYTYNAVLNAGWNIIEIMHYENIGNYLEIKCGRVDVEDINVVDDIQDVNELHEVDIFTKSPFIGLVNCNALSITYTRFVGAEFTIESDAIKQVVTEITDTAKKVGDLTTRYDSISARVEETRIDIEDLETKYTEIKNTADEINLTANQTKESVEEIETKMNGTMEVVTRLEEESQLAVKKDEISTYVQEEIKYTLNGEIEKNYVQKSELEQNNAEIKMSFSQSGGYNLIQESAFYNDEAFGQEGVWRLLTNTTENPIAIPYMRYTYEDKLGYPDPNANTLYLYELSSHNEEHVHPYHPYMEQNVDLVPGKTYTFSMQFASPDGENSWAKDMGQLGFELVYGGSTIVHRANLWSSATEETINNGEEGNRMTEGGKTADGWIKCKTQFSIPKSYGLRQDTNEDGVIDDSDIQPLTFTLRILFTSTPYESRLLIVHPLLVEGELDMVYSPNPNEMYTGVTRINKDGIKVSRSDSTVATTIDYKGMTITTDQSVAAEFRSDYAYVPVARIDKVINSNIPSKGSRPNVLIVNKTKYEENPDENTFRTLQECFDSFPDITTSEVTIEIQENTNGGYLRDKSGSPIEIILWKNVQVGSTIILSNVNNSISIHSEDQTFEENGYPYGYVRGIACSNCHNVTIGYLHLDELTYADANNLNDLGIGINAYRNVSTAIILEGSTATVKFCNVLSNINYAKDGIDISCIVAARNSRCITYNCRGNTSSRTNIKYVYLSLGYSFLYIARHNELLKDTDANINTDTVLNVLPSGIKLIKFPNNEANLTTFTNREYEANCDHFDKYPEAGVGNPSYDKISENAKVYSKSRVQQTRNYDNSNGKYMITNKINGGSSVGTVRRNNKYCYDRTIFEFDPEKFRSALFSAQTKSYDSYGNPINNESPVEAKLVIEAESIGEYVNRSGYPSSKYVPVNILMYSDLEYAYDDAKRDSADPKFGEGIKEYETDEVGRYDYVPNNVLASNTAYLDDNSDKWTYDNHGFYSGNMKIEIPIHFNMKSLDNELSSSYRNGVEDLKNGRIRYVIVETGIYAQDEKGNLIQGETASVKLKDIHFDLSYEVIQAQKPNSGGLTVPDFTMYTDFINRYVEWCKSHNITCVVNQEYHDTIPDGEFIGCYPGIGASISTGETLTITISKGPENSGGDEPVIHPIEIPDMYGWTQEKVSEWAEPNNISVTFESYSTNDVASGLVVSTSPSAGLTVMPGGSITVYYAVPLNEDLIVPDYSMYDDFESRYEDWCGENNIRLVVALEYSNSIPKDGFIRTNPGVGSTIKSGGTLSLYESKGPENSGSTVLKVPDYSGYSDLESRYQNWCSANGITFKRKETTHISISQGGYILCAPAVGEIIDPGDDLVVMFSRGPYITPVKNVPDFSHYSDYIDRYIDWCVDNGMGLIDVEVYDDSGIYDAGEFMCKTYPGIGRSISVGDTIIIYVSKGKYSSTASSDLLLAIEDDYLEE